MNKNEITPISWFEKHGIKDYDLVMSNPWKGRQCYIYKDIKGEKYFLKWNDNDYNHEAHKVLMEKEELIYKILKNTDIAPQYIGGGMFVTKFIDGGVTLRKRIKDLLDNGNEDGALNLIALTLNKWKKFRVLMQDHKEVVEKCNPINVFDMYLASLISSGPIETKWSRWMYYRNRFLLEIFRIIYLKHLKKVFESECEEVVHGDFHANNVMVDKDNNVFLLDFENLKVGLSDVELAYMVAQFHCLAHNSHGLKDNIDSLVNRMGIVNNCQFYNRIVKIYKKGISFNPRFK